MDDALLFQPVVQRGGLDGGVQEGLARCPMWQHDEVVERQSGAAMQGGSARLRVRWLAAVWAHGPKGCGCCAPAMAVISLRGRRSSMPQYRLSSCGRGG
jgi:hypothetical protein